MDWLGAFTSGDEKHAETAARALAKGGSESLDFVSTLLNHPDAEVRWWAVRTMGEMPIPESGTLLAARLSDADVEVRRCAAIALRHNPCPDAVPALLELLDHSDQLLARLAADAIIAAGQSALPDLLNTLHNGSIGARQQAVRCLAKIGSHGAIPALFETLDDDSAWIRYWADEGLERMGVGMTFFKP